ncbi:hypothetical protein OSTOST_05214 [Ostertagia ostertagi]
MSTIITCPNCTYQFEPSAAMEQAIGDKYKAEFNQKWLSLKKKQDEEIRQREELLVKQREQVELAGKQQEEEIKKKLATAIQQREQQLQEELSVKIAGDFETKLRFLEDTKNSQEKKLKEAQQREMEMLKKEAAMKEREEELELEKQRWMRAESERAFGADCHITIRNAFGQECGSILLESKRAKEFSQEWLNKLKNDMATKNADLAILVTQVMPKDMDGFGQKDGIYICTMPELKHLIGVLRQGILKVYEARKSQENKGDKMVMLYDYLTSTEFMGQWNAMRESFQSFRNTLQKERDDFEKAWKKKQKLLDVIIANSLQISGSVEGISGMESMNWTALPGDDNKELLD